jgi:putative transposase
MLEMLAMLARTVGSALKTRQALTLENLALRHQLAVLQRSARRPRMRRWDQLLWVLLRQLWADWSNALVLVRPATVVRWHRAGFSRYWRLRSGRPPGRPPKGSEIRALIRRMAKANPLWGVPRIHGELLQLGIDVSERTVSRCMPSARQNPPSQTWRTFLNNHLHDLVSIDFFTVKTAMFRVVFVLIIVSHTRRRVRHLNVTQHPTAEWTAQQVVEAFPWDTAPRNLLRDRDSIYGAAFRRRMAGLGITEVLTAPHAPWQNPYAERLIGSIRRECLDHVVPWNEAHLRRLLRGYFDYYHRTRHISALARMQRTDGGLSGSTTG